MWSTEYLHLSSHHASLWAHQDCYGHCSQANSASTSSQVLTPTSQLHNEVLQHRLHPCSKSPGTTMEGVLPVIVHGLHSWTGMLSSSFSKVSESSPNKSSFFGPLTPTIPAGYKQRAKCQTPSWPPLESKSAVSPQWTSSMLQLTTGWTAWWSTPLIFPSSTTSLISVCKWLYSSSHFWTPWTSRSLEQRQNLSPCLTSCHHHQKWWTFNTKVAPNPAPYLLFQPYINPTFTFIYNQAEDFSLQLDPHWNIPLKITITLMYKILKLRSAQKNSWLLNVISLCYKGNWSDVQWGKLALGSTKAQHASSSNSALAPLSLHIMSAVTKKYIIIQSP